MEIKNYTDLQQSKKLAEFLPPESADTIWDLTNPDLPTVRAIPYEDSDYDNKYLNIIAAWSLAALLGILPNETLLVKTTDGKYYCLAKDVIIKHYDNIVDACVNMIEQLHKLNLL